MNWPFPGLTTGTRTVCCSRNTSFCVLYFKCRLFLMGCSSLLGFVGSFPSCSSSTLLHRLVQKLIISACFSWLLSSGGSELKSIDSLFLFRNCDPKLSGWDIPSVTYGWITSSSSPHTASWRLPPIPRHSIFFPMAAVPTGNCFPWACIPSSLANSLEMATPVLRVLP